MKRLEKFLRTYRRESILAPLFKLLEVVFDLMVPVVVAQIIDVGVAKNDRGYIVEMFFVLLLMAAVGLLCSFTAQFFAAKASVGSVSYTHLDVYKRQPIRVLPLQQERAGITPVFHALYPL